MSVFFYFQFDVAFFFVETSTNKGVVNDQHQETKNSISMETVGSNSTEIIDSIDIKQEPDWDDQEEGVGVNDEDMPDSLQENEENNEDGLNSADEEEIDENNEMLNECDGNSIDVRVIRPKELGNQFENTCSRKGFFIFIARDLKRGIIQFSFYISKCKGIKYVFVWHLP